MRLVRFRRGFRYFGAADVPALVPLSLVRSALEARGFSVLSLDACDERPPLPGQPPGCQGEGEAAFDTAAVLLRIGPDETIEVPERVKWLVELPPAPVPGASGSGERPPTELVAISMRQRRVHVLVEAAALAIGVPFLGYVALSHPRPAARALAAGFALASLVVDGILLVSFARLRSRLPP